MKKYLQNNDELINSLDYNFEGYWKLCDYLAIQYQEKSKFDKFSFIEESSNIAYFATSHMVNKITKPYKCYPAAKITTLEPYKDVIPTVDFFKTIGNRRSRRDYIEYRISLSEIYQLLHYSYGITGKAKLHNEDGYWNYRAAPSGGGLYPLEIYIYMQNADIESGIYHYRPDINAIELISQKAGIKDITNALACDNINMNNACCIIFVTSMFLRTLLKYGERGYRFIMQEVGFVAQNISLICEAIGLSSCMLGGFIDDDINKILDIDGATESIQNIIVLGK